MCVRCPFYVKQKPAFRSLPVMAGMTVRGGPNARDHDGTDRGDAPQTLCQEPPATVSRWLWSSNRERKKKLILHIDLNNTILLSDTMTTQGTVAALEYFLTTVTWGRMSREGRVQSVSKRPQMSCSYLRIPGGNGHTVGSRVWVLQGVVFGGN